MLFIFYDGVIDDLNPMSNDHIKVGTYTGKMKYLEIITFLR